VARATGHPNPDSDGDGVNDGVEVLTGSNPLNGASVNIAPYVTGIEVAPSDILVVYGQTAQTAITVVAELTINEQSYAVNVTRSSFGTQYDSSNVQVAEAAADGVFDILGSGQTTLSASLQGYSATSDLVVQRCGDGAIHGTETCDDGNLVSGDGCDFSCTIEPETYTVGGQVLALNGSVTLTLGGGRDLTLTSNSDPDDPANRPAVPFIMPGLFHTGDAYSLGVLTQPTGQICSVSGGSGTIGSASVTSVSVQCVDRARYGVSVSVSGLSGSLQLALNGNAQPAITANGSSVLPERVIEGISYQVTVATQPANQTCLIDNGGGVASASMPVVSVNCYAGGPFTVGGTVSGLNGALWLKLNASERLQINGSGASVPFTFATQLLTGASYSVLVDTAPAGADCSVANHSGVVRGASVTSIAVSCSANAAAPQVEAGTDETCLLRSDGALSCFGTTASVTSSVPTGTFTSISLKDDRACAVRSGTGVPVCWGNGMVGAMLPPSGVAMTQVEIGRLSGCGLRASDSTLSCWSSTANINVGYFGTPPSGTFTKLAAASETACAIRTSGAIECWGLGSAIVVSGRPTTGSWVAIDGAVGDNYCAVSSTGTISCWGANGAGQASAAAGTDYVDVSVGRTFACGLRAGGDVRCWGTGTPGDAPPRPEGAFVRLGAGKDHVCGVRADGRIMCWGKSGSFSQPARTCGNGVREPAEACDDGNVLGGDGCSADCLSGEQCGNGMLDPGEVCDDASATSGAADTCSMDCQTSSLCQTSCPVNECGTAPSCDPQRGCSWTPKPNATPCAQGRGMCWNGACEAPEVGVTSYDTCTLGLDQSLRCVGSYLSTPPKGKFKSLKTWGEQFWGLGCALREDGTHQCWGNSTFVYSTPGEEMLDIAFTTARGCLIRKSDGSLRCWGTAGTVAPPITPATGYLRVAATVSNMCAVHSNGNIYCWGDSGSAITNKPTTAEWTNIWGNAHFCALSGTGQLRCWGGTTAAALAVPSGESFVAAAPGGTHTCGMRADGTVRCWGNGEKNTGSGTNLGQAKPPAVPEGVFASIAAGTQHSCGVKADGRPVCWGLVPSPISVSCGDGTIQIGEACDGTLQSVQDCSSDCLSSGYCGNGIADPGEVCDDARLTGSGSFCTDDCQTSTKCQAGVPVAQQCDDNNECTVPTSCSGQTGCVEAPVADGQACASGTGQCRSGVCVVPQVATGDAFSCKLDSAGKLTCWGVSGNAVVTGVAAASSLRFTQIDAYPTGLCARVVDGTARCWGVTPPPADWKFDRIATGAVMCGILSSDKTVECWKFNNTVPLSGQFIDVAASEGDGCGIDTSGSVRCWGYYYGYGYDFRSAIPSDGPFVKIEGGLGHFCALRANHTVACWGSPYNYEDYGQALPPSDNDFVDVSLSGRHACGLHTDGRATCWGAGTPDRFPAQSPHFGQGTPPAPAQGGLFLDVAAAKFHSCGVRPDGRVLCWGDVTTAGATPPVQCGNGVVNPGEACDDGNTVGGDGCAASCLSGEVCGNDVKDPGEVCDDGSLTSGSPYDFCNACTTSTQCSVSCDDGNDCTVESGCDGQLGCLRSNAADGASCRSGAGACLSGVCVTPKLDAGFNSTCAIDRSGKLQCLGGLSANMPTGKFIDVTVYNASDIDLACALRADGTWSCWTPSGPFTAFAGSYLASDLAIGGSSGTFELCLVRAYDGKLWCTVNANTKAVPAGSYVRVAESHVAACAIAADGTLQCWAASGGTTSNGELNKPSGTFGEIDAGEDHFCALGTDTRVRCWGRNDLGQTNAPTDTGYVALALGRNHSCAARADGTTLCWGQGGPERALVGNHMGQATVPPADQGNLFSTLAGGSLHSCALTKADDRLVCWGNTTGAYAQPPSTCGNGVRELGEACDDGAAGAAVSGDGCAAGCRSVERCGNGVVDFGELCDDGFGGLGDFCDDLTCGNSSQCQSGVPPQMQCTDSDPNDCKAPTGCDPQFGCAESALPNGTSCQGGRGSCQQGACVVPQVAAGDAFSCVLNRQGVTTCFGTPTNVTSAEPTSTVQSIDGYTTAACVLDIAGKVDCWGIADQRTSNESSYRLSMVDMNAWFACGIKATDGGLDCWGNISGSTLPVLPAGAFLDVAVASSTDSTTARGCAVRSDNALVCFGAASDTALVPPSGSYTHVDGGENFYCAVTTAGAIRCFDRLPNFNRNPYGQLDVPSTPKPFVDVAVGRFHACGLHADGTTTCWGAGDVRYATVDPHQGQGLAIPAPDGIFVDVAAGRTHSCGVKQTGHVLCWGDETSSYAQPPINCGNNVQDPGEACDPPNPGPGSATCLGMCQSNGTCGNGMLDPGEVCDDPTAPSLCTNSCSISHKCDQACTAPESECQVAECNAHLGCMTLDRADGTACAGGDGTCRAGACVVPQITSNGLASCALDATGRIKCFGPSSNGILTPSVQNPFPQGVFTTVGVNTGNDACALLSGGGAKCWGNTSWPGSTTPYRLKDLYVGNAACGVRAYDGAIVCWGTNVNLPTAAANQGFSKVATGSDNSCAIRADNGALTCWSSYNAIINAPAGAYTQVEAADNHFCALRTDGAVKCWSRLDSYDLVASTPTDTGYKRIAMGKETACAIKSNGRAVCWGLGDPRHRIVSVAKGQGVPPSGLTDQFVSIDGRDNFMCGARKNGQVTCWGDTSTTQAQPPVVCGNFIKDPGEVCDEPDPVPGGVDHCASDCLSDLSHDNGTVDPGEVCDDAHNLAGDFCSDDGSSSYACSVSYDDGNECTAVPNPGCLEVAVADGTSCAGGRGSCRSGNCAIRQVAAGNTASCKLNNLGQVSCVGSDTIINNAANIPSGSFDRLELFQDTACVSRQNGDFNCWGANISKVGTTSSLLAMWAANDIATSTNFACMVRKYDKSLICSASTPAVDQYSAVALAGIAGSNLIGCAIRASAAQSGSLYCWGTLCPGNAMCTPPGSGPFVDIVAGVQHFCALRQSGSLACWGNAEQADTSIVPAGNDFVALRAGSYHTCALRSDNRVECWGRNTSGQTNVPTLSGTHSDVAAGLAHSCVSNVDGTVTCWGSATGLTP
jgi:cysteine-rich repeat protein